MTHRDERRMTVAETSPAPTTVANHRFSPHSESRKAARRLGFAVHQPHRSALRLDPRSPARRLRRPLVRPSVDQRATLFPRSSVWRAGNARSAARRGAGAALGHRRGARGGEAGVSRIPFGFQPSCRSAQPGRSRTSSRHPNLSHARGAWEDEAAPAVVRQPNAPALPALSSREPPRQSPPKAQRSLLPSRARTKCPPRVGKKRLIG